MELSELFRIFTLSIKQKVRDLSSKSVTIMSNISYFSKKPKLSTFSESIFSINSNGEIKLGGVVLTHYECRFINLNRGIGFQLLHRRDYTKAFTQFGKLHRSYLDVLITINNHQKYLELLKYRSDELDEMNEQLDYLQSQDDYGDVNNLDSKNYTNYCGEEITIEELKDLISELQSSIKISEDDLTELECMRISEWNCSGTL